MAQLVARLTGNVEVVGVSCTSDW